MGNPEETDVVAWATGGEKQSEEEVVNEHKLVAIAEVPLVNGRLNEPKDEIDVVLVVATLEEYEWLLPLRPSAIPD